MKKEMDKIADYLLLRSSYMQELGLFHGKMGVVVGHWCGEVKNEALHMYLSTPSQKAKYYAADQAEHEEALEKH